jgi:hypothetical protein
MSVVVVVVVVVVLAGVLYMARRARRKPAQDQEKRRGQVDGASHMGGGRSVAPRRDGVVTGDEKPTDSTVSAPKGTSPMDL